MVGVEAFLRIVRVDGGQGRLRQTDPARAGFELTPGVAVPVKGFLDNGVGTGLLHHGHGTGKEGGSGVDHGLRVLDAQGVFPGGGGGGLHGGRGFDHRLGHRGKGGLRRGRGLHRRTAGAEQETKCRHGTKQSFHNHSPFLWFQFYDNRFGAGCHLKNSEGNFKADGKICPAVSNTCNFV